MSLLIFELTYNLLNVNDEREFHLFKSHITRQLFEEFSDSYKMRKDAITSTPFVFVDPLDGSIRLVASSFTYDGGEGYGAILAGSDELEYMVTSE